MEIEKQAVKNITKLKPLLDRGYRVTVELTRDLFDVWKIEGGDDNCPHPKHYDPSDGHGWTSIEQDDVPMEVFDLGDDSLGPITDWMITEASRVESQPKAKSGPR